MADIHILVADDCSGQRLDAFLGANDGCPTRSACAHLIEGGAVIVNGETCLSKKYAVRAGDRISVDLPEPHDPTDVIPEAIPLDIRYEDDYLIVLSKQRGLVCHPAHGHESGTLANALVYHCGIDHLGTVQGEDRPGIVHRLDRDTSGLMLAAKDDDTQRALQKSHSHAYARPPLYHACPRAHRHGRGHHQYRYRPFYARPRQDGGFGRPLCPSGHYDL